MKKLEDYVVSIPDFPEPGIIFRDVLLYSSVRKRFIYDCLRTAHPFRHCYRNTFIRFFTSFWHTSSWKEPYS